MISCINTFSWLRVTILEKTASIFTKLVVLFQCRKHLLEVEVVGECCRLSSWICGKASKIESLGYLEGLACTTTEALGTDFQQLDGIQTLGSWLGHGGLMHREHLCLASSVVTLKALMYRRDYRLVKYLTSAPLHSMKATSVIYDLGLDSPKGFWDELFDLFGLVNAETKSGCLARTIREHADARTLHRTR